MPITTRPIPSLTASDISRFWAQVNRGAVDECWDWIGPRFPDCIPRKKRQVKKGYGRFYVTRDGYTYSLRAHRVALFLSTGIDPGNLLSCHKCDNRLCCNPSDLFPGTHNQNMADCVAKHRQATGDRTASRLYFGIRNGELNGRSKLTEQQALRVLELGAGAISAGRTQPGKRLPKELASGILKELELPVGVWAIERILRRKAWAHLPLPEVAA